jgi:hypothetical protein
MDWPLEEPKGKPLERACEIRDEVKRLVSVLLTAEGWAERYADLAADSERTRHPREASRRDRDQLVVNEKLVTWNVASAPLVETSSMP